MASTSRLRDASEDDEVEFLYQTSAEPVVCQICSKNLDTMAVEQRTKHYDAHFNDEPQPRASPSPDSTNKQKTRSTFSRARDIFPLYTREPPRDIFWHTSQASSPPSNHTPGLVALLAGHLRKSRSTQRAWLCSEEAVHIAIEPWDRGWGCGYRNFLMACSALMTQTQQPMYFPLLDDPSPPGVRNLQIWIEDAWKQGFDKAGARDLKNKLYETNKWIGTADIWVAFTSRRIPAHLADFELDKKGDVDTLLSWVENYFSENDLKDSQNLNEVLRGASPVTITSKMPIILQHQGHSRTIIGYEKCDNGAINLLEFDPSKRIPADIRKAAIAKTTHAKEPAVGAKRPATDKLKAVAKRVRSGAQHDAIVIESDEEDAPKTTPAARSPSSSEPAVNTADVLKCFRFSAKSLKHTKYQVLYFPLSAPFTDVELQSKHVVMGYKVKS